MATFTSTVTEKKPSGLTPANRQNTVYCRTVTYTIPSGVTSGDTKTVMTIPAGTAVISVMQKASTSTLTGLIAYALSGTAIVSAAAVTNTTQLAGATMAAIACAGSADAELIATCTAVHPGNTITLSVLLCDVDVGTSPITTFTA
jgi:uncharacterized membrane protein